MSTRSPRPSCATCKKKLVKSNSLTKPDLLVLPLQNLNSPSICRTCNARNLRCRKAMTDNVESSNSSPSLDESSSASLLSAFSSPPSCPSITLSTLSSSLSPLPPSSSESAPSKRAATDTPTKRWKQLKAEIAKQCTRPDVSFEDLGCLVTIRKTHSLVLQVVDGEVESSPACASFTIFHNGHPVSFMTANHLKSILVDAASGNIPARNPVLNIVHTFIMMSICPGASANLYRVNTVCP